ncbi:putative oxidoreductase [Serratia fonticola]|uniref:Putative oxidoreductase n=1 Tax=Serratia fonticola TaxID=47917 RepID=A0A4U9UBY2_SERFO|nr:putative oxidoreductase [Serratia fonticola]
MIEQLYRPGSVQQALELKRQFQQDAVYFAGGSKLNATPTKTRQKIAIALSQLGLDQVSWQQGGIAYRCHHYLTAFNGYPAYPAGPA